MSPTSTGHFYAPNSGLYAAVMLHRFPSVGRCLPLTCYPVSGSIALLRGHPVPSQLGQRFDSRGRSRRLTVFRSALEHLLFSARPFLNLLVADEVVIFRSSPCWATVPIVQVPRSGAEVPKVLFAAPLLLPLNSKLVTDEGFRIQVPTR